jgi:hypothetical protein
VNLSKASTDSYSRFHRFHEAFNRLLPVGTAGFVALERIVDGTSGSALLSAMVDAADEPWTKRRMFHNPTELVQAARTMFCNMAVVRAVAAFDDFTISLIIDAVEFSDAIRASAAFSHAHTPIASSPNGCTRAGCCHAHAEKYVRRSDLSERIEALGDHFGWNSDKQIVDLLPLWHYFRRARNRIVHGDGTAGEGLAEYAETPEVISAFSAWNRVHSRKRAPALPSFASDEVIAFEPRHAILAQSVQYAIAKRLNPYVVATLKDDGMVAMAVYYGLFAKQHPYRTARQRTIEGAVNHFLSRYRVTEISEQATKLKLNALGLRAGARLRFKEIYG